MSNNHEVLFFFSQLNALDTVPLRQITAVEKIEDHAVFNIVDGDGNKLSKSRKLTNFIEMQITEFGLEVYGS